MSRKLVSTRGLLYFLMLIFLVFSFGCSDHDDRALIYTANGTYTYSKGTLTMNWINSDFLCNGPKDGFIDTKTDVTISNTALTWSDYNDNDVTTWTRQSGTASDPAGTWTATDLEGNMHVLTIEVTDSTSGTMSLSTTIHSCAGDFNPGTSAVCGNGVCQSGENASNCPEDCGIPITGGLGNFFGNKCAQMVNGAGNPNPISWKGTWVADHSFGWDAIPQWGSGEDYSCRHYGGTIFNNIQVKDSHGKIYNVAPHVFSGSFDDEYITYFFDGTKVKYCGEDPRFYPGLCPD